MKRYNVNTSLEELKDANLSPECHTQVLEKVELPEDRPKPHTEVSTPISQLLQLSKIEFLSKKGVASLLHR